MDIAKHWHTLSVDDVFQTLETDTATGLASHDVTQREAKYGANKLIPPKQTSAIVRFLLQFHQPLIYILLGACAITLLLQEWTDASVIFGVVLINAIVGYVQEAKALNALNALKGSLSQKAMVIRNGKKETVNAESLVPGDIVMLTDGERVPADVRIVKSRDLKIDESALTGESLPVEKCTQQQAQDAGLGDRRNMGYSSTLVTYGLGTGVVTATGKYTEIGKISTLLSETETLDTPLTQRIKEFSHLLLYAILVLAAVTFVAGWLQGYTLIEAFMAAVALAVGAIPEGLPAAVTIMLAIGVARMARRNAIIRQLPAVETLGSTTVICSDKTGTLTKNAMTVHELWCEGDTIVLSGSGYTPQGDFTHDDKTLKPSPGMPLYRVLLAGAACNDATLIPPESHSTSWRVTGDPTEAALKVAAHKAGITDETLPQRLDEVPFRSESQFMATLHDIDGTRQILMKGSAEAILSRCRFDDEGDKQTILAATEAMAAKGLRVLAFAHKHHEQASAMISEQALQQGFVFLGLQGMIDPPREEAIEAVAQCRSAGVGVKMITGDHAITATAIASSMGIVGEQEENVTHTGAQLDNYDERAFDEAALNGKIFARVSPQNKLALVTSLQKQGQVVAMTGDGVNDAPALRRADVGVAMALDGTDVARDAADMMLTDDNFATVTAAVEEGRGIFDNLKKFIVWTLPTNGGEALVILIAVMLGVTLPLTPLHILWVNMTTAVCLGLMLAFEPKEHGIMQRKPHAPSSSMLDASLMFRIVLVSVLLTVSAFGLYYYELSHGATMARAQTVAVTMFVVGEAFYLFNCRSLRVSVFRLGMFSNQWIWIGLAMMALLQVLFIYAPWMQRTFNTVDIDMMAWLRVLLVGAILSALIGLEKKLMLFNQKPQS